MKPCDGALQPVVMEMMVKQTEKKHFNRVMLRCLLLLVALCNSELLFKPQSQSGLDERVNITYSLFVVKILEKLSRKSRKRKLILNRVFFTKLIHTHMLTAQCLHKTSA